MWNKKDYITFSKKNYKAEDIPEDIGYNNLNNL